MVAKDTPQPLARVMASMAPTISCSLTPTAMPCLGLFNCTICLPQIVAAATGGLVLRLVGDSQPAMLLMAGVYLVLGAVCVRLIKK